MPPATVGRLQSNARRTAPRARLLPLLAVPRTRVLQTSASHAMTPALMTKLPMIASNSISALVGAFACVRRASASSTSNPRVGGSCAAKDRAIAKESAGCKESWSGREGPKRREGGFEGIKRVGQATKPRATMRQLGLCGSDGPEDGGGSAMRRPRLRRTAMARHSCTSAGLLGFVVTAWVAGLRQVGGGAWSCRFTLGRAATLRGHRVESFRDLGLHFIRCCAIQQPVNM